MKTAGHNRIKSCLKFPSVFILLPSFFCFVTCLLLSSALAGQVNINRASHEELTALPYIGTARAQAIINFRKQHGPFRHVDDLLKVANIGPKSLEAIAPHITLSSQSQDRHATSTYALSSGQVMLLADDQYFPTLINFIKTANQRIEVAMFLFKTTTSKNNKPTLLVKELIKAQKRGVDVQVILEESGYSESINKENQQVAATLRTNDIMVRFDSPATTTHTKLVLIDNRFCFVGSHNLTHSALAFNHEISLLLDNRTMAKHLRSYLATIE